MMGLAERNSGHNTTGEDMLAEFQKHLSYWDHHTLARSMTGLILFCIIAHASAEQVA